MEKPSQMTQRLDTLQTKKVKQIGVIGCLNRLGIASYQHNPKADCWLMLSEAEGNREVSRYAELLKSTPPEAWSAPSDELKARLLQLLQAEVEALIAHAEAEGDQICAITFATPGFDTWSSEIKLPEGVEFVSLADAMARECSLSHNIGLIGTPIDLAPNGVLQQAIRSRGAHPEPLLTREDKSLGISYLYGRADQMLIHYPEHPADDVTLAQKLIALIQRAKAETNAWPIDAVLLCNPELSCLKGWLMQQRLGIPIFDALTIHRAKLQQYQQQMTISGQTVSTAKDLKTLRAGHTSKLSIDEVRRKRREKDSVI